MTTQDFVKGVDLSIYNAISGTDLNNLVDQGEPASDRGLILTTLDIAGNPVVPDPSDIGLSKLDRYIWRRVTATTIVLYSWNPAAGSDPTYLKWQSATQLSIAPLSVTSGMLAPNSVTDDKVASISAVKITGLPTSFAPTGNAGGDLVGSTYPNPVIAPNAVTSTKLSSSATDDTLRAVGNDHVKNLSLVVTGAAGKLAVAGVAALQSIRMNAGATAWEAFTSYFTQLATLGTAYQLPRVNTGATAIEWVDSPTLQQLVKSIAIATGSTSIPVDTTPPLFSEGDALTSLAITPKLATSLLKVEVELMVSTSASGNVAVALFRDGAGSDPAVAATLVNCDAINTGRSLKLSYVVAAGATTATTFSVRIGSGVTWYVNRTNGAATLFGSLVTSYIRITEFNGTLS